MALFKLTHATPLQTDSVLFFSGIGDIITDESKHDWCNVEAIIAKHLGMVCEPDTSLSLTMLGDGKAITTDETTKER